MRRWCAIGVSLLALIGPVRVTNAQEPLGAATTEVPLRDSSWDARKALIAADAEFHESQLDAERKTTRAKQLIARVRKLRAETEAKLREADAQLNSSLQLDTQPPTTADEFRVIAAEAGAEAAERSAEAQRRIAAAQTRQREAQRDRLQAGFAPSHAYPRVILLEDEDPPAHWHPHYYNGKRDFQCGLISGGPTCIYAVHPYLGEVVKVEMNLLPGAPRIKYSKHCIVYEYPTEQMRILFSPLGGCHVHYSQHKRALAKVGSALGNAKQQTKNLMERTGITAVGRGLITVAGRLGERAVGPPLNVARRLPVVSEALDQSTPAIAERLSGRTGTNSTGFTRTPGILRSEANRHWYRNDIPGTLREKPRSVNSLFRE